MLSVLIGLCKAMTAMPPNRPLRKTGYFLSRFLVAPRIHARWIDFISGHCARRNLARPPIDLLEKTVHPYLCADLDPASRLAIAQAHYRLCDDVFSLALREALWSDQAFAIARLETRDASYDIWLERARRNRQEGEMTLSIAEASDRLPLALITFSLTTHEGRRVVLIGGLQGQQAGLCKDRIIRATRQCGGLRPKSALMTALRALAEAWSVSDIHAVSRARHVSAKKNRNYRKRVVADYDCFWLEQGGEVDPLLGYRCPAQDTAQKIAALPAKKRGFVEQIRAQCAAAVAPGDPTVARSHVTAICRTSTA